ncbi:MAG: hypothetical protein QNJ64_16150 [Crocosphaera sp.]|nr:hypothetical protein [Crocosphaera sp.]
MPGWRLGSGSKEKPTSARCGKGGEGHIIYPENMPIKFEKQSREERQQEQHMIYVSLTRCLARAKGGILWLVLAAKDDKIEWPKWLPHEYRKLWNVG